MSGSIAGLLGALDQQTQLQNSIQQPEVQGLLGSATQLLPSDPFAAQRAAAQNPMASANGYGGGIGLAAPGLLQSAAQGQSVPGLSQKDAQDELERRLRAQIDAMPSQSSGGGTESGGGGGGGEINAGGM